MMRLLLLLTCLFFASSVFAQTQSPLPNVGIEISPSSVITKPISTLSLRATAYSSLPNCDIVSYTWSTLITPTPTPTPIPGTSSQPIFTAPNDRITSITGLTTLGTYNFQIVVSDLCNATTTLTFNSIVANSSLASDFFVLPPTIVTTPGFVFPPTLPPTLPPITSAPVDPTPPPVDPSLPGDPNAGAPVGGEGGGGQQQPNPPVVNAGQGGGGRNNSPSNTNNSSNMIYVVIPAAVVGGLLLLGICVYCRRKSQIPTRTQSSSTSTSSIIVGTKISQPFEAFTGANQLTSPV